jgi:hypothetical protein
VGYPSQFPSVSMMDYNNGKPNARYWVLRLIKDNFHAGDKLVTTTVQGSGGADPPVVQAFQTQQGRKLLVVNRANEEKTVTLPPDFAGSSYAMVDESTGDDAPHTAMLSGANLTLAPFAVTVVTAH